MSETPTPGNSETAWSAQASPGEAWSELRRLILGPERHQIDNLQEHLDNLRVHPEDVSQVLAEAVLLRSQQDKQLTSALLPAIEEALQASVRKNPRLLIDVLFPLLGPAIRKAISAALRSMLEVLNHSLEMSLSVRALRWRLEAWRTGKPFAEVLLLHTLAYRVEQVFLIHKETGLLLQHVVADSVSVQDAALVSGMLTAIQDFMRDSFGGTEEETLNTVQYGDRLLLIEQGPLALLVGVVRGSVPQGLQTIFQEAIESIHFEARDALLSFQGDATPFEAIRHHLDACLQQQMKASESGGSALQLWVVSALLLLGVGGWGFVRFRAQQQWLACLEAIRAQPGVVLLSAERGRGGPRLTGMLDPLAPDPLDLPAVTPLCPEQMARQWRPYYALHPLFVEQRAYTILAPPSTASLKLDPDGVLHATGAAPYAWMLEAHKLARLIPSVQRFQSDLLQMADHPVQILARARALLAPPETVTLRFENGLLTASGEAPHGWILTARQQALSLAGVHQWREEQLVDGTLKVLQTLRAQLETYAVHFQKGNAQPVAGQEERLSGIAGTIQRLAEAATAVGSQVQIEVFGHTDRSGSVEENLRLSQERADYVMTALQAQGLSDINMVAVPTGGRQPLREEITEEDRAFNRRVSLRALLTNATDGKG